MWEKNIILKYFQIVTWIFTWTPMKYMDLGNYFNTGACPEPHRWGELGTHLPNGRAATRFPAGVLPCEPCFMEPVHRHGSDTLLWGLLRPLTPCCMALGCLISLGDEVPLHPLVPHGVTLLSTAVAGLSLRPTWFWRCCFLASSLSGEDSTAVL